MPEPASSMRRLVVMQLAGAMLAFSSVPPDALAHGSRAIAGEIAGRDASRFSLARLFEAVSSAHAASKMRMDNGLRIIESDGLPDHATGTFPNRFNPNSIRAQNHEFRMPAEGRRTGRITPLVRSPFGIALNGVLFDPGTAEFWNDDPDSGWNYEALSGRINLGLDSSNAHVQPNGAYHYHGLPVALLERLGYRSRPALLGYAADGFPVYGPFGARDPVQPGGAMVELRSSYRLRSGTRPEGPGGQYDGSFAQDYEYVAGLGDLDECNGREGTTPDYPRGTYYYVVTAAFPFLPRCHVGTPDRSFERRLQPGVPPKAGPGKGPPKGPGFKPPAPGY